jgi:cytochrome b subunit of formate dehydrogenase
MLWRSGIVVGTILAAAAVFVSFNLEQNARDWVQFTNASRLGGSDIFANSVLFARAVPFLLALGIALGLLQASIRRPRPEVVNGQVRRHEWTDVITHWVMFGAMLVLWATALLMLPGVLFDWAQTLVGPDRMAAWESTLKVDRIVQVSTLYGLHYVGAALAIVVAVAHLALHLVSGNRGLRPRSGDFWDALAITFGYLGIYGPDGAAFGIRLPSGLRKPLANGLRSVGIAKPRPPDKYLSTERVVSYWPAVVLIGLLVVTGIIKAIHYLYPIPGGLRQLLTVVHDISGIVLLVWMVLHVAAVVVVPGHWPLLKSMFTARVPEEYVEAHHPVWYKKLRREPVLTHRRVEESTARTGAEIPAGSQS